MLVPCMREKGTWHIWKPCTTADSHLQYAQALGSMDTMNFNLVLICGLT